jgi:hypothetical protein
VQKPAAVAQAVGRLLLAAAPKMMKALTVIGTRRCFWSAAASSRTACRVFAGAGAFHGQRTFNDTLVDPLGFFHVFGVVGIDQHDEVEVAVADVAEEHDRDRRLSARSSLVAAMHSASREIGTQTSVGKARQPGFICRQAK